MNFIASQGQKLLALLKTGGEAATFARPTAGDLLDALTYV